MAPRARWTAAPVVLSGACLALLAVFLRQHDAPVVALAAALLVAAIAWGQLLLRDARRDRVESERRALEAHLLANEAARETTRARNEFLANMSHEIRTPLNGIIGMAELAFETELTCEQREYLGAVRSSAGALLSIVDQVLDFSRLEAGELQLEERSFALHDVVDAAVAPLSGAAAAKGLRLHAEIDDVPSRLVGDGARLRQVLACLASNAVKFTDSGSVTVRAGVLQRDAESATLLFAVEDTGVGIPSGKQAAVFGAFTQVDGSSTRRHGGTGLGLAVSRNVVELLGGQIWVESVPGRGSAFFFTARFAVDASRRSEAAAPVPLTPVLVRLLVPPRRSRKVLLAEDNEVNQELVGQILLQRGHDVTVVETGALAVEAVAHGSFDLVLMDVEMPGMDGLEATRRIRHGEPEGRRIPIVALTAHADEGDATRFLAAGMDGCLSKPFSITELIRVVEGVAGGAASPVDRRDLLDRVGGDESLYREVTAMFCRELPRQLDAIRASIDAGDAERLERAAHSLKGACAVVGAAPSARLANALEELGERATLDGAPAAFAALQQELGAAAAMFGSREALVAR